MKWQPIPKAYLGNGVYAIVNESGQLVLTTEDGVRTTNVIYLEPELWERLCEYVNYASSRRKATDEQD